MRIALVTCSHKPDGNEDDHLLAQELRKRGHEVAFPIWSDPGLDWTQFSQAVLRSPWDYYKRLPEFLAWAEHASGKTRLLNPLSTVRTNAEKDYLLELENLGLPVVPSWIFADPAEEAYALLNEFPLVVKPTVSGGSYLTYSVKTAPELKAAFDKVLAHGKALVQPFLPTVETEGEISLMYFRVGKYWKYSHSVLKTAAPGDFRVQTDFGGKVERFDPTPKVTALASQILETLAPEDLYVRIDLVNWRTQPLIGELELIEPALFFAYDPSAAPLLASALESLI
jgi:glutathione synthase/RimK-type ligase-like ATP-grasp enzyme